MRFLNRELQRPRPECVGLIMEEILPCIRRLQDCMKILRPDLDDSALMDMTMSVFGQVQTFRDHLAMIRILRGEPSYPRDLQAVIRHFTEFSLRGIGVAEAFSFLGA